MSKKVWSIQEVVASLEAQAAHHREREAYYAAQVAFHQEHQTRHAAELELLTRRLEEFRAIAEAAVDLAARVQPRAGEPPSNVDFGPASRPRLFRMVKVVLEEISPTALFGAGWVTQEINRRWGEKLRKQVDVHQIADTLRRMHRLGQIHLARRGRPHHEARYTLAAVG